MDESQFLRHFHLLSGWGADIVLGNSFPGFIVSPLWILGLLEFSIWTWWWGMKMGTFWIQNWQAPLVSSEHMKWPRNKSRSGCRKRKWVYRFNMCLAWGLCFLTTGLSSGEWQGSLESALKRTYPPPKKKASAQCFSKRRREMEPSGMAQPVNLASVCQSFAEFQGLVTQWHSDSLGDITLERTLN